MAELTCRSVPKRTRKRRLNFDDCESPESSKKLKKCEQKSEKTDIEKISDRRRILTPKRQTPTKPTLKRSLEIKEFETAISLGSWYRVLSQFGNFYKKSFAMLEGVDLNLYDKTGMTAFHAAILTGDCELAILMLKNGAKYELSTFRGWTYLHLSANNTKMLRTILDFICPKKS